MFVPDSWIIIKINIQGTITYRLYSCWIGGYWDSDYWRLNSGITSITAEESGSYNSCDYKINIAESCRKGKPKFKLWELKDKQ